MNILKNLVCGLVIFTFASCNDDDTTPFARVSYQFDLVSDQVPVPVNGRVAAKTLEFNSGSITVREIVFDGERQGASSVSITHEQISTIDFATGVSTPDIGTVNIPAGTYTSVNLGVELQDENDDPTVVLEGTYVNADGISIPIRFEFNSGEVFEADAAGPITLAVEQSAIAKITFDPSDWFSTITTTQLDNASLDSNGVIVISETSNAGIFDIVADRLDLATSAVFE